MTPGEEEWLPLKFEYKIALRLAMLGKALNLAAKLR